jgi:murein DD-endopeptidase MepM/ murein hydrolase activator NlpD
MRLRLPAHAAVALALALAASASLIAGGRVAAQSPPAEAAAEAAVADGDLGLVGRAAVQDEGRDDATESASRSGMEIAEGRAAVRASRRGGRASARASATAEGVSLFDGLVTADRVRRTATAADGAVAFSGSVAGLVVDGELRGDLGDEESWSAAGMRVTVNRDGAGLRVRLTRAVAGFASGTTVVVAGVAAEAVDGAAPAATATPTPAPTVTPDPAQDDPPGDGSEEPGAEPVSPRVRAERRLARGRFVFPVYGDVRIADDFGAARQIGAHRGNDVFAAFGSPVLAVADGTLNRVGTLPISGNRLWLETERGDSFFYAHLSAFGPEAQNGRTVKAGTLLGFTGNTGDAEPTPPHVHFEIHPSGVRRQAAIDPHEVLLAWQARGELPAGGWLARYGDDTEARPGALVEVRDFIAGE